MAEITGDVIEIPSLQASAHPSSRTTFLAATRSAFNRRLYGLRATVTAPAPTTHTVVVPTSGSPATPSEVSGDVFEFIGNTGLQWFEHMHIFPGGATLNPDYDQNFRINFGNILADTDKLYEIYNASRRLTQTLNTIDLTQVNPGITTPDVSETDTVTAQTSILDPTSTFNSDLTSGLGVKVITTIRALEDGVPQFTGDGLFIFGLGIVALPMTGSRIALALSEYEAPMQEFIEFATDVISSTSGNEQRVSLRKEPREGMRVTYRLDGDDRRRFQVILMDWQHNPFGVPLWHELVKLTATSAVSATQWQVSGAADVDFRVGALAILFTDPFTFEVATIASVTDTLITVTAQNTNSYPAGTAVMPVRIARIVKFPSGSRHTTILEDFGVTYEWLDNVTGTPASSSADWNSNTFNSRILLDDCNVITGSTMQESFVRSISIIDNETGVVAQRSGWDKNKHTFFKGFVAHTRAELKDLKALLRHLRGRQKSFYMPNVQDDLIAGAALISSSQILDIENILYVRHVKNRGPKKVIRISFTDNPTIIRTITSSAAHPSDSELERLTIDTGWDNAQPLNTIIRIEFLELVRMDADKFTISIPHVGQAHLTAPVRVVFDDD